MHRTEENRGTTSMESEKPDVAACKKSIDFDEAQQTATRQRPLVYDAWKSKGEDDLSFQFPLTDAGRNRSRNGCMPLIDAKSPEFHMSKTEHAGNHPEAMLRHSFKIRGGILTFLVRSPCIDY